MPPVRGSSKESGYGVVRDQGSSIEDADQPELCDHHKGLDWKKAGFVALFPQLLNPHGNIVSEYRHRSESAEDAGARVWFLSDIRDFAGTSQFPENFLPDRFVGLFELVHVIHDIFASLKGYQAPPQADRF